MLGKSKSKLGFSGGMIVKPKTELQVAVKQIYKIQCFKPNGRLYWEDYIENLVVLVGRNAMLDEFYRGSAYTAAHYCLLTNADPVVADSDTMASHPGWTELTAYDQATRPVLTMAAASGGLMDNSASPAVYTINASVSIGGAGVTDDSTKGGATGLLVGAGALVGGNKPADVGYTFNLTVQAALTSS